MRHARLLFENFLLLLGYRFRPLFSAIVFENSTSTGEPDAGHKGKIRRCCAAKHDQSKPSYPERLEDWKVGRASLQGNRIWKWILRGGVRAVEGYGLWKGTGFSPYIQKRKMCVAFATEGNRWLRSMGAFCEPFCE